MNKDLTLGDPQKVLRKFCIPLFGSIIFQQMYNLADSWVAGRFVGENALAAVGNSYEITLIFIAFAFGCNMGCSVITSTFFGAKDYRQMKTAISTSAISSAVTCALLMIIGLPLSKPVLALIQTPLNLLYDSYIYLSIYILGLPFVFFYNLATGIFSALGDSKTPFYFLAVSSVSNIAVDILFVYTFRMGVAGVAWATYLCQGVSCILSIAVLLKRLKSIKTDKKPEAFSKKIFIRFISIAVPSFLQQSFISFGNIIIQGIINSFGAGVMAGYSAAVKLNNLVITSFTTLGNGVSNYTSQNIGAMKAERIKPGFRAGLRLIWCISIPITLIYFIFPETLLRFFLETPSEDALRSGMLFLRIIAPFYMMAAAKLIADGVLRGAGMMNKFMVSALTDLAIRVILAFILSSTALRYVGIWCAWPVGWGIATALSLIFYKTGKYDKKPV